MPRPTPEELIRINASLKQYIESGTTPKKALLKKYESLVLLRMPRDNPCIRPTPGIRGLRHDRFLETAKSGDFDILFLGDSRQGPQLVRCHFFGPRLEGLPASLGPG